MATTVEEIEADIREALTPGFRDQLMAKGQARSMIWEEGALPEDAPRYSPLLSYNLSSYGYSLLGLGLRLLEAEEGDRDLARRAFKQAADAIEAVSFKGAENPERDFHRFVAAAAYHLARYSARAFSMLVRGEASGNWTLPEQAVGLLIRRELGQLLSMLEAWQVSGIGSDEAIAVMLSETLAADIDLTSEDGDDDEPFERVLNGVVYALNDNFVSGLATALLAFERGERALLDNGIEELQIGLKHSGDLNLVPQWWCYRLTTHLLDDLWNCCLHNRLPLRLFEDGAVVDSAAWVKQREILIASLYTRQKAEIELWPSQLQAAKRAVDLDDDMVVSLPTSAGKTRIAELCILATLAVGRRVVFVTPLRALSAQTEATLHRTFGVLGRTVSSLYGSIGVSGVDQDALRTRDIVIATPEKLDFALRNDGSLLDDVGLVVLDEGHMIGLGEREVRYEVQIQRLLKRSDAADRRIVCLSAVLPEGKQLQDFADWLTQDNDDGIYQNAWRPTDLWYGDVRWIGESWWLNIEVDDEEPFVPGFVKGFVPPIGTRKKVFPTDQRELCLATAWRLAEDGQSVLVFCPMRKSVEPFAKSIVKLVKQGALASVLNGEVEDVANALAVGEEWFGTGHPILECLKLGVAIHHGALPTPFRKEVERLLRANVLRITVSSPTLAQGLNLSATSLVFFDVCRAFGEAIDVSEFRNVVGRAGRAFVDLEGLVVYPMFDNVDERNAKWQALVDNQDGREMESGLLRLLVTLLERMRRKLKTTDLDVLTDYVVNNAGVWEFPQLPKESELRESIERGKWGKYITSLDTAVLSLLGEHDIGDDEIESKLDEVLESSLFARRAARRNEVIQTILKKTLAARAKYIWAGSSQVQRKGYFLAGVGFEAGQSLDANAEKLGDLLVQAEANIALNEPDAAIAAITEFAEIVLDIPPFTPSDGVPDNWKTILRSWLKGEAVTNLVANDQDGVLNFIEQGLVYNLSWAMEAVRVRGQAHDDGVGAYFTMLDMESGKAVAAVETGTLNRSATILMQSGFGARSAALKIVHETGADFETARELRAWLRSDDIVERSTDASWPTPETHTLWRDYLNTVLAGTDAAWVRLESVEDVDWEEEPAVAGSAVRIRTWDDGVSRVLAPNFTMLGKVRGRLPYSNRGQAKASVSDEGQLEIEYLGPLVI